MYKDKDKQREANRQAKAKQRVKAQHEANSAMCKRLNQGMTKGMTNQGMTARNGAGIVIPCSNKRGKDIKVFADLPLDVQATINHMSKDSVGRIDTTEHAKRTAAAIKYQHIFPDRYDNRSPLTDAELVVVTGKPGDADYNGICTEEWRQARGR